MKTIKNHPLAPYTSLRVGGPADITFPDNYDDVCDALRNASNPIWLLGYGSNSLISDRGLPGTVILWRSGSITVDGATIIADAGVWWDDVVKTAIEHELWGLELMSEVPSSVGGAVYGNIAAYGQQVSDTLAWVELYDSTTKTIKRVTRDDITFAYRESSLQSEPTHYILRAAFQLSHSRLHELKYDSALMIATELGLDTTTLSHCRDIIIETRLRAGSIYHPDETDGIHTAGSFFKNPLVSSEQATMLARFDETGKTLERIINQSKIHGGSAQRASAAHVLLAAGFHRGQRWGNIELHPSHILKVATLDGATAQEVYDVAEEIISTVKQKLDIDLVPEVRFLGDFSR